MTVHSMNHRRIPLLWTVVVGVSLCLCVAACSKDPQAPILLNFHTIDEGNAYRSPQLSGEALSWVIDHYGIKTVINLRGPNPGKVWYDDELSVCKAKKVALVDIPMSSQSLPPPDLLKSVVSTLKTSARPLLIHCQSGADRTGAVSALYRIEVLGQDRTAAMRELSPEYWHFRDQKPCMDKLIEIYEPTDEWMASYEQNYQQIPCGG